MKKLNIIFSSVVLLSLGCGLNQDPLANKGDEVKNVQVPQEKVKTPEPEKSEAIRINSVPKYTFSEGREGKFSILSSVLASDYDVITQISNEADFPGATFDSVTGEFAWTPPKGLVFDGLSKTMELKVRVFAKHATDAGAKIFTNERTVEIVVERAMDRPIITTVSGLPADGFVEGASSTFTVLVHDEDAGPASETYPRLELLQPDYATITLTPFIRINKITPDFQKRDFLFELSIESSKGMVEGYSSAGFGLRAVSRYNKPSNPYSVNTKLLAKFGDLKTSWTEEVLIPTGLTYNYSFIVYESTARAEFEVVDKSEIPADAEIKCDEYSAKGFMTCNFKWKVSKTENLGPAEMSFKVKAVKRYYTEVTPVEETLTLKYKVVKGPGDVVPPVQPKPPVDPPGEDEGEEAP
tara:strand:- start:83479 stop:84708 length:1230 start_codon:yes stop_codon:yes gene_type:complete